MVSHPSKRPKPPVNVHTLSSIDQQVLERAAALLNKSVADLLQSPEEDSSHVYATPASQAYLALDFHGRSPATPNSEHTQTWLPEGQQTRTQSRHYNEQFEQINFGTSAQPEHFGPDLWPGMQTGSNLSPHNYFLPQEEFSQTASQFVQSNFEQDGRVFKTNVSGAQTGSLAAIGFHGQSHHHGENQYEVVASDSSSEVSEIDHGRLDSQPWENVQINAVEQLISSENDPDSDYLFLDEEEEQSHVSSNLESVGVQQKKTRDGDGMLQNLCSDTAPLNAGRSREDRRA